MCNIVSEEKLGQPFSPYKLLDENVSRERSTWNVMLLSGRRDEGVVVRAFCEQATVHKLGISRQKFGRGNDVGFRERAGAGKRLKSVTVPTKIKRHSEFGVE